MRHFPPYLSACLSVLMFIAGFSAKAHDERGQILIKNYDASDYSGHIQNWDITQDHRGVIYVANNNAILEFDGNSWRFFVNQSQTNIRSLDFHAGSGKVFVGGNGEIGYLSPDITGKQTYHNLLPLLDTTSLNFQDVWRTFVIEDMVYFCSMQQIMQYNISETRFDTVYKPESVFHLFHKHNNKLYTRLPGQGVAYLENNEIRLLEGGEQYKDEGIFGLLPHYEYDFITFGRSTGFFAYKNGKFVKPTSFAEAEKFLLQNSYYYAKQLSCGKYAFATVFGGVLITDKFGKTIRLINKENGLQDQTALYIFEDRQKNLWVPLYRGLSRIETNNPWEHWTDKQGLEGVVEDMIRFNDTIYVATSMGVYYLAGDKFQEVSGIRSQCWAFHKYAPPEGNGKAQLMVAVYNGVYRINGETAELATTLGHVYALGKSHINPNIMYAGTQNGLVVMNMHEPSMPDTLGFIPNLTNGIRNIYESDSNELWLGTNTNTLYKVDLKNTKADQISDFSMISRYDTLHGLPKSAFVRVFELNNDIAVGTSNGLFLYNRSEDRFFKDTILVNPQLSELNIRRLKQDENGDIWVNGTTIIETNEDKTSVIDRSFRRLPADMLSFVIYPDDYEHSWLGGTHGLYRIPINRIQKDSIPFQALIRSAQAKDSLLYAGMWFQHQEKEIVSAGFKPFSTIMHSLDYAYNHLIFTYAAPFFENEEKTLFSYKLEGFDKDWSDWSREDRKEYTNLSAGQYTFKVRAKNIYGEISKEDSFVFRIQPPWYLHFVAIIGYIILLGLLVYVIVRYNSRRLKEKNRMLLKIVDDRTQEIQKQKNEIELQNARITQSMEEVKEVNDMLMQQKEDLQAQQEMTENINQLLEKEKKKSDNLLLNILPEKTAEELKSRGKARALFYKKCSVLFTDFVNFSTTAQSMQPEELVNLLDSYFVYFDNIAEKYNVEKIKTIGDSYMCAAGLPEANEKNPLQLSLMAMEILHFAREFKKDRDAQNLPAFDIRIGIHTGEVVAGVVGKKKFAYDIWGNTVNIASRVESTGEPNKVNISGHTWQEIKDYFQCSSRGVIETKNTGKLEMYFVESIKPEWADATNPLLPSENAIREAGI